MRTLDESTVYEQLERVLASKAFDASERNRKFLRYVVEETLDGRATQIKAYCIAVSVFKRESNFDPQSDPIVRLEAGRLRRSLEHYYLTDGRDDPIRIVIPKGSYAPRFEPGGGNAMPGPAMRWWHLRTLGLGAGSAVLAALVCVAMFVWFRGAPPEPEALALTVPYRTTAEPGRNEAIVVAPFRYYGAPPDQSSLAAALTEQVVHDLAARTDIEIRVAESGAAAPAPEFRLDGSIQMEGSRVRVLARLSEAETGSILWSEQFDHSVTQDNAIEMPQTIGDGIVAQITQPRGALFQTIARRLHAKPQKDLTPKECALLAAIYRNNRTAEEHAAIRACLERRSAEANDAAVWAALSLAYADEHLFGFNRRPDLYNALDRALEMALRAVELAPGGVRPRVALYTAYCLRHQYDLCFAAGDQALAVAADDPQVLADMGLWHVESGDPKRGIHLLDQAIERDPSQATRLLPAYGLAQARLGGDTVLAKGVPTDGASGVNAYVARTVAFVQLGRMDEAHAIANQILAIDPGFADRAAQRYRSQPLPPSLYATIRDSMQRAGLRMPD
ncbi:MAG TPA: hypothetical protein VD978_24730 [Azospirillum sp.]|nr:hypothetical protein [Azospirillum sp.]